MTSSRGWDRKRVTLFIIHKPNNGKASRPRRFHKSANTAPSDCEPAWQNAPRNSISGCSSSLQRNCFASGFNSGPLPNITTRMGRFNARLSDTVLKYSFQHGESQIFPAQQNGFKTMCQPNPKHEIGEYSCPCEGSVWDEEIFGVLAFLIQQG